MKTIQILIPDSLAGFIKQQTASKGFPDEEAFVISVLEKAKDAGQQQELEDRLLEGIESLDRGEGQPVTAEMWDNLKSRITENTSCNTNM